MDRMLGRIKLGRGGGDNGDAKRKRTPTEAAPGAPESEAVLVNDVARNIQWCDFLSGACGGEEGAGAGGGRAEQLIGGGAAEAEVLSGARRCGRRFMRVFSDNLHNYYVDLLDSKHMMEFRARALKRRLCRGMRRQPDNQLYRSNSFKFERFERKDEGNSDKQVRHRPSLLLYCAQ